MQRSQIIQQYAFVTGKRQHCQGEFRDYPAHYLGALVDSHANMTIRFITEGEDKQTDYKQIGCDIFCIGIIR